MSKALRPTYLEGMRGIASWIVVFHHFAFCFGITSAIFRSNAVVSNLFLRPIFDFLTNGHFAVMLFFVHSGLVLSFKYFTSLEEEAIILAALKRYFRLIPPAFASILFAYLLLKLGAMKYIGDTLLLTSPNGWLKVHFHFEPNLWNAIKQALYFYPFTSIVDAQVSYNTSLWTIGVELSASYLVFSLLLLAGKSNIKVRLTFYLLACLLFIHTYFFSFILGVALCDFHVNSKRIIRPTISSAILIIGMYFSSFRADDIPNDFMGTFIQKNHLSDELQAVCAAFLIFSITKLEPLQRILDIRIARFLGKISFSVYLVHVPILTSLGCLAFVFLSKNSTSNSAVLWCTLAIVVLAVFAVSLVFTLIDQLAIKKANFIANKLYRMKM